MSQKTERGVVIEIQSLYFYQPALNEWNKVHNSLHTKHCSGVD